MFLKKKGLGAQKKFAFDSYWLYFSAENMFTSIRHASAFLIMANQNI